MEVILIKDYKGLGYKHDTVAVKDGFGRNYLIPQGYAIIANATNKKIVAENIKQAAHKAEKLLNDAEAKKAKIEATKITIKAKIGESGKIFGAVTTLQLSDALKAAGVEVDRKQLEFDSAVKEAGEFTAVADLHKTVKATVTFVVAAE